MTLPDVGRVTEILRAAARDQIMPRFRRLEAHQIREKSPGDLVTEADVEAERQLERDLTALLPGSAVVGEEAVAHDPQRLSVLEGEAPVWIIDPVDGTANFARHRPVFGVIVALVKGGRTLAGWIHDPVGDVTATAVAGQGAWMNGRRLRVADEAPVAAMTGSLGYRKNKVLQSRIKGLVRNGSVAHDYMALADGRIHFAYYRRLTPWDHAAGVLMHAEAGGYAALIDGSPYRPRMSPVGVLLAPSEKAWRAIRDLVED